MVDLAMHLLEGLFSCRYNLESSVVRCPSSVEILIEAPLYESCCG